MSISLKTLGTTHLGKTGNIRLSEVQITGSSQGPGSGSHGFDREYSDATIDYLQVNPFLVYHGNAPHPTGSSPYQLSEWVGYTQWEPTSGSGSNFDVTNIDALNVTFKWDLPLGYELNSGSLRQRLYAQTCSLVGEDPDACIHIDPYTIGFLVNTPNDVTESVGGFSNYNTRYVASLYTFWNVSGSTIFDGELISSPFKNTGSLTLGTTNDDGDGIYFTTGTTTTTTTTLPCKNCGESCTGGGGSGCGSGDGQGTCCAGLVCDSILSECVPSDCGACP